MGQRIGLITVRTHAGVPDGARALCDISFRDCRLDRSRVIALEGMLIRPNQSFQVDAAAAIDSLVETCLAIADNSARSRGVKDSEPSALTNGQLHLGLQLPDPGILARFIGEIHLI